MAWSAQQSTCSRCICQVSAIVRPYPPITVTGDPKAECRIPSGKEEDTRNILEGWCQESELGKA